MSDTEKTKDDYIVDFIKAFKAVEDEMADYCRQELERFIPDSKFFACTPGGPG